MVLRTGYIVYFWNIPKCDDGDNLKLTVKTTKTVITNAMSSWTIRRAYQWVLGKWFFPLQTQEGFSIWQVTFAAALLLEEMFAKAKKRQPNSGELLCERGSKGIPCDLTLWSSGAVLSQLLCLRRPADSWSGGKNVAFNVGG